MTNLKKYAAIGGAIVLVGIWPLAVGQIAQRVFDDGFEHIQSPQVTLELLDYQRGYLSAQAHSQLTITDPLLKQQFANNGWPTQIRLEHQISHGLISISTESKIENMDALPLTIHSLTQLNGDSKIQIGSGAFNFKLDGHSQDELKLSAGQIEANVSMQGKVAFNYQLADLEANFASGEALLVKQISGAGEGQKRDGFWFGEQNIELGEAKILDQNGGDTFDLQQFSYQFSAHESEQKTITSQHVLKASSVFVQDETLTDLAFDFALQDLDSEAFLHLVNTYQNPPQQFEQAQMDVTMGYVDTLFEKGFTLSLNQLKASIGTGQFTSQWQAIFPAGNKQISNNPMQVLNILTGNIDSFIANDLVKQYPYIQAGLDNMVKMGAMTKNDMGYVLAGKFNNGNVEFASGKKVPIFALFAPMMMQY